MTCRRSRTRTCSTLSSCDLLDTGSVIGITVKVRPLERAAFFSQFKEKKLRNLVQSGSGAAGNAATRIEAFVAADGLYSYGSYADIEGLFREQAAELDPKRREAILHKLLQLMHDKVMFAPIWELGFLNGHGPRVAESGLDIQPRLLGPVRGCEADSEVISGRTSSPGFPKRAQPS
jgi:ABC-type transport system substrate-binding protein